MLYPMLAVDPAAAAGVLHRGEARLQRRSAAQPGEVVRSSSHGHHQPAARSGASVRLLLQRVSRAEVRVATGRVGPGHRGGSARRSSLLVGFTHGDSDPETSTGWPTRCSGSASFGRRRQDELALADVGGALLVVSQFTLYGDAVKGRRPSFIDAARPEVANPAVRAVRRAAARARRCRSRRASSAPRWTSSW